MGLHNSSFIELSNIGKSLISNRELEKQINRLYQFDYPHLLYAEESDFNDHRALTIELNKYLSEDSTGLLISSQNYNKLLSDLSLIHI